MILAPYPGIPDVYTTPHMVTAKHYRGNTAESRIGKGPLGYVVLECFCNLDRRIGKVDGKKLNKQWLFHPNDLVIHKYHFICTGAADDDSILRRWEMDANERTTTLKSKPRRDLSNALRRAQELLETANINVARPKPKRQPKAGSRKFIMRGSVGTAVKKSYLKEKRQRRRSNAKARASQEPAIGSAL